MKIMLMVVAIVWLGSMVAVAITVTAMWRSEKRKAAPASRRREVGKRGRAASRRELQPDPGLLVPWSAVCASKRRLGARPISSGRGHDAPPLPRRSPERPLPDLGETPTDAAPRVA